MSPADPIANYIKGSPGSRPQPARLREARPGLPGSAGRFPARPSPPGPGALAPEFSLHLEYNLVLPPSPKRYWGSLVAGPHGESSCATQSARGFLRGEEVQISRASGAASAARPRPAQARLAPPRSPAQVRLAPPRPLPSRAAWPRLNTPGVRGAHPTPLNCNS